MSLEAGLAHSDHLQKSPSDVHIMFLSAGLVSRCVSRLPSSVCPTAGTYEEVAQVLALQDPAVSRSPAKDRRELFKRLCIALLTGNGDMHGENMAMLVGARCPRLAPVYDPAPMRAFAQHDMFSALPWMKGDPRPGNGLPGDLAHRLERLASEFGVGRSHFVSILGECLDGTADYLERVDALPEVPEAQQRSLRLAVEAVRYRLQRHHDELAEPGAAGPAQRSGF